MSGHGARDREAEREWLRALTHELWPAMANGVMVEYCSPADREATIERLLNRYCDPESERERLRGYAATMRAYWEQRPDSCHQPDMNDALAALATPPPEVGKGEDRERLDWIEEHVCELSGNVQRSCAGQPDVRYSPWHITIKRWPESAGASGERHFVHQGSPTEGLRAAIDAAMREPQL